MFVIPSHDGEVKAEVTPKFFLNPVVKYMNLGIVSLASYLECEVEILDASSMGLTIDETINKIEEYKPDVLAITAVTFRAWAVKEILERTTCKIKSVGGPHATSNANNLIKQGATAVFVGDGDITFPTWIDNNCPNGIFTDSNVDLNKIPIPDRNVVNLDDYKNEVGTGLLTDVGNLRLPMFSSKGCPFKCIYCDVQGKEFLWKTPETFLKEFEYLISIGATSIHILDDCFNINRKRVVDICNLIKENDIKIDWSVRGKVETREEVIKSLAEAGCKRFHVGIEHLDDNVLKYFRKNHRYRDVEVFCNLCKKYGIQMLGYFIIGAPDETKQYRKSFPDMIKTLGINIPYFNVLTPLSETPYYDMLMKNGLLKKDYWKEFVDNPIRDFKMPSGRTKDEDEDLYSDLKNYMDIFYKEN